MIVGNFIYKLSEYFLGMNEYESVKKNYTKVIDAYGCLGIMRINAGKTNLSLKEITSLYLALNFNYLYLNIVLGILMGSTNLIWQKKNI